MPEPKHGNEKKRSLHPLTFEDALRGLLAIEPPSKEQEMKDKPAPKRRSRSIGKKTDTK